MTPGTRERPGLATRDIGVPFFGVGHGIAAFHNVVLFWLQCEPIPGSIYCCDVVAEYISLAPAIRHVVDLEPIHGAIDAHIGLNHPIISLDVDPRIGAA